MAAGLVTEPYWWEAAPPKALPKKAVQPSCDVVIVGSGYAGMSAALVLARAGRSVQVFDKQHPGAGASSRNGGLASGNIRTGFGEMIEAMGLETARRVYGEGKVAREGLATFIDTENIASQSVLEKCGLVYEGRRRAYAVQCPGFRITRQGWSERNPEAL